MSLDSGSNGKFSEHSAGMGGSVGQGGPICPGVVLLTLGQYPMAKENRKPKKYRKVFTHTPQVSGPREVTLWQVGERGQWAAAVARDPGRPSSQEHRIL